MSGPLTTYDVVFSAAIAYTDFRAIVGMAGNGPIQGKRKPAGVPVAGRDMPGVDATCCRGDRSR